jgi:hypothetical protein
MMSLDEVATIFRRNMTALVNEAVARRRRREEERTAERRAA